ncbi:hypothetical protein ACH4KU_28660 [Streptomyces althioticus]|uniref:hypothetical protein n=1 Tax=Streptomyces althioticus TaxID=83380 RepID=UPI003699171E
MRRPTTGGRQARRLSAPVARLRHIRLRLPVCLRLARAPLEEWLSAPVARLCLVARLRLWAGVRHIRLRLPT